MPTWSVPTAVVTAAVDFLKREGDRIVRMVQVEERDRSREARLKAEIAEFRRER